MTLELKQYPRWNNRQYQKPYTLRGIKEITNQPEGRFAITISDRWMFIAEYFEFVRDKETGKYFVKDGVWVGGEETMESE